MGSEMCIRDRSSSSVVSFPVPDVASQRFCVLRKVGVRRSIDDRRIVRRSRVDPLANGSTDCRGSVKPFLLGSCHQISKFCVRESCGHHMGRMFRARWTSPSLLQQLHVMTCLGLIGPLLHLGVRDRGPADRVLVHINIALRNSDVAGLP